METPLVIPVSPGLVIGLSLGALGGGGSILTVPALVYLLGQDPRTATTSSLLIVGLTSLLALTPHARTGRVRFGQGLMFGALGTGGSFAGSPSVPRLTAGPAHRLRGAHAPRRDPDAARSLRPEPAGHEDPTADPSSPSTR